MPQHLVEGLRRFRADYFPKYRDRYRRLATEGQKPSTLFLGCSDSRVVPELLTDTLPGELFIVRNVGNLVPPFEPDFGYHGTSAAIEFATLRLGVRDIVVCGHSHCGAIRALYAPLDESTPHITRWLELARPAALDPPLPEDALPRTEKRSVVLQVERLMSYPMVRERVDAGQMGLHGWYFVIELGAVHALSVATGEFVPLLDEDASG